MTVNMQLIDRNGNMLSLRGVPEDDVKAKKKWLRDEAEKEQFKKPFHINTQKRA
jgi:hypothetical protein